MIVRCLRLLDPLGRKIDGHPYMSVGARFVVLEVLCVPGTEPTLRVYSEEYHGATRDYPGLWPAKMFEVLDPSIPPNWQVNIGGLSSPGYVKVAPESWHNPGFWEDLEEWSPMSERATEPSRVSRGPC